MKTLARIGIPNILRGQYWQTVTGAKYATVKNAGVYEALCERSAGHYEVKIKKDLARTLPSHSYFKRLNGFGQKKLFNVLKAYAVLDPDLGYCQGMSFITAVLLLHMDEEAAFWVLCDLIKSYNMRGVFGQGLPVLRLSFFQLHELIRDLCPRIHAHFSENSVTPLLYASEWISTLFVYNFPLTLVTRIWDVFLLENDHSYIFKISLAVLKLSEEDLLKLEFEEIVRYLKTKGAHLDPDELIAKADSIDIPSTTLPELEKRWQDREKREWASRLQKRGITVILDHEDLAKAENNLPK
eukprot:TRINITY_DN7918_c0_g1_i1.p1 TRINITY_DN7918_c0_g1~~TRINITY_DN7918_c0_g1_i1.p1  ORF type:complete len:344 (+),score=56.90 TRINITY_DN7918_c0_g1_i1:142-1032(+)